MGVYRRRPFVVRRRWLAVQFVVPVGYTQFYGFTGLIVGLFAVMIVAIFVGAWRNEGRIGVDRRLICPHCCRPLPIHSALVIETGICPHCGERVLADWLAPIVVEKSERGPHSIVPRGIGRGEGRATVLRLRLRRLMAVIVYVAVTVALVLYAFTITGTQPAPFSQALFILTLIPLVWCVLSVLVLAPVPIAIGITCSSRYCKGGLLPSSWREWPSTASGSATRSRELLSRLS